MQWDTSPNAGFSASPEVEPYAPINAEPPYDPQHVNVTAQMGDPDSLLNFLRGLIALRKTLPVLAHGGFRWLYADPLQVLSFVREDEGQKLYVLHNLSDQEVTFDVQETLPEVLVDVLSGSRFADAGGGYRLTLQPYQSLWLAAEE